MSHPGPSKARKSLPTRRQNDFGVLSRDNHDSSSASYTRIPALPNQLSDFAECNDLNDDKSETITTSKYRNRSSLSGFQYSFERSHPSHAHALPVSHHHLFQSPAAEWHPSPTSKTPLFDVESDFEKAASDSCDEEPVSSPTADAEVQRLRQELASLRRVSLLSCLLFMFSLFDLNFMDRLKNSTLVRLT